MGRFASVKVDAAAAAAAWSHSESYFTTTGSTVPTPTGTDGGWYEAHVQVHSSHVPVALCVVCVRVGAKRSSEFTMDNAHASTTPLHDTRTLRMTELRSYARLSKLHIKCADKELQRRWMPRSKFM